MTRVSSSRTQTLKDATRPSRGRFLEEIARLDALKPVDEMDARLAWVSRPEFLAATREHLSALGVAFVEAQFPGKDTKTGETIHRPGLLIVPVDNGKELNTTAANLAVNFSGYQVGYCPEELEASMSYGVTRNVRNFSQNVILTSHQSIALGRVDSTLAHERVHAETFVLSDRGVPHLMAGFANSYTKAKGELGPRGVGTYFDMSEIPAWAETSGVRAETVLDHLNEGTFSRSDIERLTWTVESTGNNAARGTFILDRAAQAALAGAPISFVTNFVRAQHSLPVYRSTTASIKVLEPPSKDRGFIYDARITGRGAAALIANPEAARQRFLDQTKTRYEVARNLTTAWDSLEASLATLDLDAKSSERQSERLAHQVLGVVEGLHRDSLEFEKEQGVDVPALDSDYFKPNEAEAT